MKKLLALAAVAATALITATTAEAASGYSQRDAYGNTYTSLTLDNGRTVELYPTSAACGPSGVPYDYMAMMINSGNFHAWVDQSCGPLIRVCLENYQAKVCSTYARRPVQAPNRPVYNPYRGFNNGF